MSAANGECSLSVTSSEGRQSMTKQRVGIWGFLALSLVACGGGGSGGGDGDSQPADSTPDVFQFDGQPNVPVSSVVTSGLVTITGIDTAAQIGVLGGQYSIGCSDEFTAAAGTINNGQTVCVRHTSAPGPGTVTSTILTVGGVLAAFTSTTEIPPDATPDAFYFNDLVDVEVSSEVTSAPITITGIDSPADISVVGGEYSIGCGGVFTGAAGHINNGETVCVRHTSAPVPGSARATNLTVGGITDTFTSRTAIELYMGSGTPPSFTANEIAVAVPNLSADGATALTVALVIAENEAQALYAEEVSVAFTSACIAANMATITGGTTTSTGMLTVTYTATGCSGSDTITASATVEGRILTATGTVTVAPVEVGSIEFLSATPTTIGLQGTSGVGISESSSVVFRVLDSVGDPLAGREVQFSLDTAVGGIQLQPTAVISGSNGTVATMVDSGTVAASVRVTATDVGTNIATQSSQLTITTGLPRQDRMSAEVSCHNVEALTLDGTQVDVTVRMADRFSNPVPDGTTVTFTSEAGAIQGSCATYTTLDESGLCTVSWISAGGRPANGRSTLLATAVGEESTTDFNGNGYFDGVDTWTDLPEVYRDDNENGAYDLGEFFVDFNSNLVRDLGNGQYNGLLCVGPGNPAGGCATSPKLTVSAQNLIIMSGSTARIADSVGGQNYAPVSVGSLTGTGTINVLIGDVNGQPMPAGTTITATTSNGNLVGPSAYTVPCTTNDGPLTFSFTIQGDTNGPATGILTIEVEVPSGLVTTYFVNIND